jgi:hypothetical protein
LRACVSAAALPDSIGHGFIVLLSSDARNLAIRHMVRALRDGCCEAYERFGACAVANA